MLKVKVGCYVAVVIMQICYAGMFLLSKATFSSGMKPSVFVVYRQAFATLALSPVAFFLQRKESPRPLPRRVLFKLFVLSSFGLAFAFNLNFDGLKCASATLSSAIQSTSPSMIFIMALCLRIEKVYITQRHGMAKVAGTLISLSGAMVFTFYNGPPLYSSSRVDHNVTTKGHTQGDWIKGSFLSIAAQLSWSLWLVLQGPILEKYSGRVRLTALQCGFSCISAAIYAAAVDRDPSSWKLGWNIGLLSVAYVGIVVTGLSYWLQAWVIEQKGATFSAVFNPLALVLSAILSAIFLGETLHLGSVLGGVLIIVGLYCFLWGENGQPNYEPKSKLNSEVQMPSTPMSPLPTTITIKTCTSPNGQP